MIPVDETPTFRRVRRHERARVWERRPDHDETSCLGEVLISVVERGRCGILLVEHDMALVMRICEHLYVLDFGELLFEESPGAVAESPVVKAAYLGSEAITGASPVPLATATERLRP
jgi:ABC-type cobalamin/Fe3+-siderophores transport system ATPase subunit